MARSHGTFVNEGPVMRTRCDSIFGRHPKNTSSERPQPRHGSPGQRRRGPKLTLERLEDRTLPSVNWVGANGDWSASATNWFDDVSNSNHVPVNGDDVVINNGATVTYDTTVEINTLALSATSALSINGNTLTIDSNSTIRGNLTFVNGNLKVGDAAADVVTVDGLLTLHHGIIFGPGTISISANGSIALQINGGGFTLDGCQLDNNATATWTSNQGQPLSLQNGAVFNNNGTFDIQVDSQIAVGGGTASAFNNTGIF